MLSTIGPLKYKETYRFKVNRWGKIYRAGSEVIGWLEWSDFEEGFGIQIPSLTERESGGKSQ